MWAGKTYWLIGASEGLGRALAAELDAKGARLVLSARSAERLEELAKELRGDHRVVACDVTDSASVAAAWGEVGEVDGVVYLAGLYDPMAAQDWVADKVEVIADVNFMGAVRVLGHVVPAFVRRGAGHIALVGSLAGYRGLPGAIGYGASKAGLMHLAENLQADLWRTAIRVQLLNPGFIRTRLTEKNEFAMPFLMEPEEAARIMRESMEGRAFKRDFPWGFSLVFRLSRLLPLWLYDRVFARG
jgi:short-subunit dehydrogenase